ncbi:MAG TPA: MlaD family protein, partial [Halioglobus sp.]
MSMNDKPHTVAIGAFVIGASLIALVTLLFLLGPGFSKKDKVVMVFDGSVKGLKVGAPMALRGVQVGEVTNIDLILDSDTADVIMIVEARLDPNNIRRQGSANKNLIEELIARGMRAQLNSQSLLTGLLYVELDFYPETPLKLADIESPYIQLPTVPTNLQRIAKKLEDVDVAKLAGELESISNGINTLVSSEEFQGLPANLTGTLDSLRDLSDQLQKQLASTGPKFDSVLDKTADTVEHANAELPKLVDLIEGNLKLLNAAITSFEQGMAGVEGLVSPDSATLYQLNKALQEMTRAGRSLQSLANTLEEQPEALIRG